MAALLWTPFTSADISSLMVARRCSSSDVVASPSFEICACVASPFCDIWSFKWFVRTIRNPSPARATASPAARSANIPVWLLLAGGASVSLICLVHVVVRKFSGHKVHLASLGLECGLASLPSSTASALWRRLECNPRANATSGPKCTALAVEKRRRSILFRRVSFTETPGFTGSLF